jgi:hypothetical protein
MPDRHESNTANWTPEHAVYDDSIWANKHFWRVRIFGLFSGFSLACELRVRSIDVHLLHPMHLVRRGRAKRHTTYLICTHARKRRKARRIIMRPYML